MKSPLASALLLVSAVVLFVCGAMVARTADSPKSHPVVASSP
jgi:hypothetical protein